jgi:hypothetical protein
MVAIGITIKTMGLDQVMATFLPKEVRLKYYKYTSETLVFHGILKEKGNKRLKGKFKSHGRRKYPRKCKEKCWNYVKVKHFKRDYKEEKKNKNMENNDFDVEYKKYSQEDGGDTFVVDLAIDAR